MENIDPNELIQRALASEAPPLPDPTEPGIYQGGDGELYVEGRNRGKLHRIPRDILPNFRDDGTTKEDRVQ